MAVIFDCSSNMAMFRKPYTTTSSVSFAFPPPTALAGLLGAIVGLDNGADLKAYNSAYWNALSGTKVSVALHSPINWLRTSLNFWNLKNPSSAPHVQIKHQFISTPRYRVYVKGGIEKELSTKLQNGEFVYTPFLGVANALASIEYVGRCDDTAAYDENVKVSSVIPVSDGMELNIAGGDKVFKEIVPFRFTEERALDSSVTVLYTDNRGVLLLKKRGTSDVTDCMGENVAWFPEW